MIRSLPEPSTFPAPELRLVHHQSYSSDHQRVDMVTMLSPASPGQASPPIRDDDIHNKPEISSDRNHKPIITNNHHHPTESSSSDTRTIRFAKQQRIKPISNSFLASDKIRSLLWHPVEELEERTKHWRSYEDMADDIKDREEGLFFLQMLDCPTHMEAPQEDDAWSPQQEERVHSAIQAVLNEQGRQNKQQEWIRSHQQQQPPPQEQPVVQKQQQLSVQHDQTVTGIGISKEEKDKLRNQDQTPMFMIALQYSWHTGRATEAANNRAIQLAMEIKRLWKDDNDNDSQQQQQQQQQQKWSWGGENINETDGAGEQESVNVDHSEEKKEEKVEGRKDQIDYDDDDDEIEEETLNDEPASVPKRVQLTRGESQHSTFSADIRGLQKLGSSRSMANDSKESLLHPDTYHGDKVHLVLPSKVVTRDHPKLTRMLKKQRSRARLSARGLSLKEGIQEKGAQMMRRSLLKKIESREKILVNKDGRKEFFKSSVKRLITLNRFFQQVEGVSKDRAMDADKKKFLAAIAAKKSSVFQSMEIPENVDDDDETEVHEATTTTTTTMETRPIQLQSVLLTPATKALRPKQTVVWGEKLHRVKFFPEFPISSEKDQYFYSSEDISRFRFEKFMEDHNDEYEEEVLETSDEEELETYDEDDEYSYEEISYHSESNASYYEEVVVAEAPPPPKRDFAHLFETQDVNSDGGRRLSL